MTSADTHADTVRLLEANNNFGASDGQITLMQQDLVPSLMNNEGLLATAPGDPFCLSMKPHGALLSQASLAPQYLAHTLIDWLMGTLQGTETFMRYFTLEA